MLLQNKLKRRLSAMRSFIAVSRQLLFLMKIIFFLLIHIHLILTDLQMKLLQNLSWLVLPKEKRRKKKNKADFKLKYFTKSF